MFRNDAFAAGPEKAVQAGNQAWWESRPMTYDWEGDRAQAEGTREWFGALDEEFWSLSRVFAHPGYPGCRPFSELIDYEGLQGKDVLEVGCGSGAHAALLATAARQVTAVDLTGRAVGLTRQRCRLFGIDNVRVMQCDAERLPFDDNSFDFIWSWGVIHHSANTDQIVGELQRVLRPNGRVAIMVYHRHSSRYWIHGALYQGIIRGQLLRHRSVYAVNMTFTDGYIARHYTRAEAHKLFSGFRSVATRVMDGPVPAMVPGWNRLSNRLSRILGPVNRLIARRWGWFLFVTAEK